MHKITGVVFSLALAGCASTGAPPPAKSLAQAEPKTESKSVPRHCLQATGSLIKPAEGRCAAIGQSFTAEELERTGHYETGNALRSLVPALR